jgi:hypothetical protein
MAHPLFGVSIFGNVIALCGKLGPFDGVMLETFWQRDSGFISLERALRRKSRRGKRATQTARNGPNLPPESDLVYILPHSLLEKRSLKCDQRAFWRALKALGLLYFWFLLSSGMLRVLAGSVDEIGKLFAGSLQERAQVGLLL